LRVAQERLDVGQATQKGANFKRIGGGGVAEGVGLQGKLTNDDRQVRGVKGVGFCDTHPKKTLKTSVSGKTPESIPGVETDMTPF
jgi:hypothetical protein